ncbi:MAG: hypothetical protein HDT21_13610 [Ruminococcus sp.]|nr:hypothetical protein [Ruminococcus sp.]
MFYHNSRTAGEYTKIGTSEYNDKFAKPVEENPAPDGQENKIASVSPER